VPLVVPIKEGENCAGVNESDGRWRESHAIPLCAYGL
jgi:hypothetical protein